MPGLPIEPDLISQAETLTETSPGAQDSLVDNEPAMNFGEPVSDDGGYKIEEAEIEQLDEELREIEPPDEDQMEDVETPAVHITGPDTDLDDDADDEDGDENPEDSGKETSENNGQANGELNNTCANNEDVMERLKVDEADGNGESDGNSEKSDGKRSSEEVFHDAVDPSEIEQQKQLTGDPGGTDNTDSNKKDNNIGEEDKETVPESNDNSDNVDKDIENELKSNNNIEKDGDNTDKSSEGDKGTDTTVNNLNEPSSEQV